MQNHTFEMSAQMRACGTEHKARDCKALSSSHPQAMVHIYALFFILLSPFGILLQGTSFPLLYIQPFARNSVIAFARKKGNMNRYNRPRRNCRRVRLSAAAAKYCPLRSSTSRFLRCGGVGGPVLSLAVCFVRAIAWI